MANRKRTARGAGKVAEVVARGSGRRGYGHGGRGGGSVVGVDSGSRAVQVLVVVAVLGLAAIPFGLGKYIELNSPGAFDSGSNVYSAYHILQGARIGVEEVPAARLWRGDSPRGDPGPSNFLLPEVSEEIAR